MNKSEQLIQQDQEFGASNYSPIPVVIEKGKGEFLWDVNGQKYIDMMSAYSAVSLGHSNKKIIQALMQQAKKVSVTSRAMYNDKLPEFNKILCEISGLDKCIPMNSGAEAVETALKLSRKWAYEVKGVSENKAIIVAASGNFHGRTLGVISLSTEPQYKHNFGPLLPNIKIVNYSDIEDLRKTFQTYGNDIACFILEPIQGEAGIIVPSAGYLKEVRKLCDEYNVLMVVDEIQTGLGRTGKLFCHQHENIVPDLLILGKALGGGLLPVSAVIGKKEVLGLFKPGDHGSTFGGNSLSCAVALEALSQINQVEFLNNVQDLGDYLKEELIKNIGSSKIVKEIRGKGLFIGVEFYEDVDVKGLIKKLLKHGIITKETHEKVVRLAPPLMISKKSLDKAIKIITKLVHTY